MSAGSSLCRVIAAACVVVCCSVCASPLQAAEPDPAQAARDAAVVQAVLRLDNFDLDSSEKAKAAVLRYLAANRGSDEYFELIKRFQIRETHGDLLALALEHPEDNQGVAAARLLLELGGGDQLLTTVRGKDPQQAIAAITVLGLVANAESLESLLPLLTETGRSLALRSAAVSAIGESRSGQQALVKLVVDGKLPRDLQFATANVLLASADATIRNQAAEHLKLPDTAGASPLPPVRELASRSGSATAGKTVFHNKGTCIKCHKIRGEGKEVGPDLSEIGSKLSKEAFYVAILDPSAGISHNYETYALALADGNIVSGLLISKTNDAVTIRTDKAIDRTVSTDDIDEMIKQKVSLMPAGLSKLLTEQELVDLVEYLTTLKKKS